ncbi:MAG: hypothetical protein KAJ22_05795 [Candidatus Izimaplasma sp.]|nr:hypothetical protein [Candidatus Izimaplasma bacterium]
MDMNIKPSRMLYYIPFIILVFGSYFFFYAFNENLNADDNEEEVIESPIHKMVPGIDYTIEVTSGEAYFIMVGTQEIDDILFYSLTDNTTVQISSQGTIYSSNFIVYEQSDPNNIMYLHEIDDNFKIDDYTVVLIIEFEEPGTYVICSSSSSVDLPVLPFAYLSENHEDYEHESITYEVDSTIIISMLTIFLTFATFVPIHLKRSKAKKAIEDSPYQYYQHEEY